MTTAIPRQIGHFQIERLLGQGGMGAVYLAVDPRLRRRVALKVLPRDLTDNADDALAEARIIASLNHPHVAQIYDVLETDEQPVLVLEWVDGVNLAQLQGGRALPMLQVYHYSQQILDGLVAVHRLAIAHRDLKAENIMVNSEGRLKILDFGLAAFARHDGLDDAQYPPAAGTCRCHSPEQARGERGDTRADLFAFGVLLYELLSGHSPFLRDSAAATLTAIREFTPPRLDQIDGGIPAPLADLAQQLLAKDPAQRPASAELCALELEGMRGLLTGSSAAPRPLTEEQLTLVAAPAAPPAAGGETSQQPATLTRVSAANPSVATTATVTGSQPYRWWPAIAAAGLIIVSAALFWLWRGAGADEPLPRYVAIAPAQINGINSGEQAATLRAAINLAARQELENRSGLFLITGDAVTAVDGDVAALGHATGADEVVYSNLVCAGNQCNVQLQRLISRADDDSRNGAMQQRLWSSSFTTPAEVDILYRAMRVHLSEGYAGFPSRIQRPEISATDLDRLLWLQTEFERNELQHLDTSDMLARVDELLAQSPTLEEARILRARILLYRYHQQHDPADLSASREALSGIADSPYSTQVLFNVALAQDDLDTAAQALETYSRLQPGSAHILSMRSRLAERQGDEQRALVLMHEAAQRQPLWQYWFWAAGMAYRQGELAMARSDLEALLDLIPEHYAGLSLLAEIELQSGNLSAAEVIYQRLVMRSPQLTELSNLGLAYLFQQRFAKAAESFRQALALAPDNPFVRLNLADALSLDQRNAAAREQYQQIVDQLDPQSELWSELATLAQSQAQLQQHEQARATLQRMLQLAQGHPQALYSAALVYALLGDDRNSDDYRQRAQEQGVAALWFHLPWFEAADALSAAD
ncbi:MAG: hypothetical protein Tsb002_27380 [Wenzhouxiangellaceae bacterium]